MTDLAIIGGGPAGYVAAERAGAKGLSVTLFEKNNLGGVCLNEGCVPTKTLLYSAKVYDYARHGDKYGVTTEGAAFDYGKIVARKNKVVRKLVAGIGASMKAHGVNVVKGGRDHAIRFMDALRLVSIVTHVADARSCVLHPASHTHRQLSDEQLVAAGVAPDLIRFSVGIEDIDDILADVEQALEKA